MTISKIYKMESYDNFKILGVNKKSYKIDNNNMKTNDIWIYLLASILGVLSILLPTFFLLDLKQYDYTLFPMIRNGIEGISIWSFGLLLLSGFGVKFLSKLKSWTIGLSTMALFPVLAIFEMIVDSSSHSMFPIEFILYSVYSIPAIIGAYISQVVQKYFVNI